MKVIFTGWQVGIKTVSLIQLVKERVGVSLSEAKRVVDALLEIPVTRLEMADARQAAETADALLRLGLPCSARGTSLVLSGWKPGVDREAVLNLLARPGHLSPARVEEFVQSAVAGPCIEVECSSASLAAELSASASACGAVCHLET
jgi:hypothetical protein